MPPRPWSCAGGMMLLGKKTHSSSGYGMRIPQSFFISTILEGDGARGGAAEGRGGSLEGLQRGGGGGGGGVCQDGAVLELTGLEFIDCAAEQSRVE